MTMRKIVMSAAACALAMVAAAPAASASAAPRPAASKPAVVTVWKDLGWRDMKARPAAFYFGNGASPYLTRMKWKNWKAASAYGTGRLHIQRVVCQPTAAPGCTVASVRGASVRLTDVKVHAGKRYFSAMTVRFRSKGKELTRRLAIRGGYWTGPSAWPYL